jgi:hypothetical protein
LYTDGFVIEECILSKYAIVAIYTLLNDLIYFCMAVVKFLHLQVANYFLLGSINMNIFGDSQLTDE